MAGEQLLLTEDEMLELGELLSDLHSLAQTLVQDYEPDTHWTLDRLQPIYARWAIRLAGPGAQAVMQRRSREQAKE